MVAEFGGVASKIEMYGYLDVSQATGLQRSLSITKQIAVKFGLMPKTMRGKRLLKRLVFGRPVTMPAEINDVDFVYNEPVAIPSDRPDERHRVIYCAIKLK